MAAPELFKGYEVTVATDSLGGTTIGKVASGSLSINNNIDPFYAAGSSGVNSLKAGNIALTGSISLAFVDKGQLLDLVDADTQVDDDLYWQLDDGTNTSVDLTLNDVRYGDWTFSFANDGATVIQSSNFFVKTLTVGAT